MQASLVLVLWCTTHKVVKCLTAYYKEQHSYIFIFMTYYILLWMSQIVFSPCFREWAFRRTNLTCVNCPLPMNPPLWSYPLHRTVLFILSTLHNWVPLFYTSDGKDFSRSTFRLKRCWLMIRTFWYTSLSGLNILLSLYIFPNDVFSLSFFTRYNKLRSHRLDTPMYIKKND